MENWFITSLNLLFWGVNLMILAHTFTKKSTGRLVWMGAGFIVAGFIIFAVGIWIWPQNPHGGLSFTSIGFPVLALGATTIIKARGRGQVNAIRNGAWSVIGVGVTALIIGLFLFYQSFARA